ncbi:membrane-associated phospholipid phosphatase [Paucilactobacillus hokkaidonensis JCM 18461]|uniref:Membrane-associated phospholipid phosphatase n=2 Tax=Paucilactobacillus hokkaidonensis TaxID=1193095 RepID=A0A0A1GWU2_9LACO|nr:phosphatase PAP2 family protein [Paucilactobacillus hokkaidonensis]KRO10125.1 membrane-associated phospholipid phosphatase [Paucilactobacillus hokkaidonensis]BAP85363.1 membrane-associated phospholipid phosphatase [Paucilactobacillus hokkaidonensis JCM 18461]
MNAAHRLSRSQTVLFIIACAVFVTLFSGVSLHASWVKSFDMTLIRQIRFPQTDWKSMLLTWYTTFFNTLPMSVIVVIGTIIFAIEHRTTTALFFILIPSIGSLVNAGIKHIVARPRPNVDQLMHYGGYSFPSGHAIGATLILGAVIVLVQYYVILRWQRWLTNTILLIMIILVGYSRIYVGVHYPSDVVAGFCLGYIILMLGQMAFGLRKVVK